MDQAADKILSGQKGNKLFWLCPLIVEFWKILTTSFFPPMNSTNEFTNFPFVILYIFQKYVHADRRLLAL